MYRLLLIPVLLLAACTGGSNSYSIKDIHVNPLTDIKANLAFTCLHEKIAEPSQDTDTLFQYARWLQKNNQLKRDKNVDLAIERLYRIAAENGHIKANINLQNGAIRGQFKLRGAEHRRLSQDLTDVGVATGYLFIAMFLRSGSAGLQQDEEMSLRYYRKAADMGNAQAQYYVGGKLEPSDMAPKIALQMYRCAAEQGSGGAALALGVYLKTAGRFQEALEALHFGVAAGNSTSASFLRKGFSNPASSDELYYLGQHEDIERAERYKTIWRVLARNSYADPKVPEINEILPLPPAKLLAWDGKLQWREARLANIPPEKPSDALIQQLAKAKLLDPATGRATPDSPAFIKASAPQPTCSSGQACPETGYWQAARLSRNIYSRLKAGPIRRFEKDEILPTLRVEDHKPRFLLADKITVTEENIEWHLLGSA